VSLRDQVLVDMVTPHTVHVYMVLIVVCIDVIHGCM
jgi:hypothetical protein